MGAWISVMPVLFLPTSVFAALEKPDKFLTGDNSVATKLGTATPLPVMIANIINILISILGIIFVIEVVWAGFLYLTAMGDKTKIDKAKTMLTQGIIGLVLILMAYGVATFVIDQLTEVTTT